MTGCSSHAQAEKRFASLEDDDIFFNLPEDVARGERQLDGSETAPPIQPPVPKRARTDHPFPTQPPTQPLSQTTQPRRLITKPPPLQIPPRYNAKTTQPIHRNFLNTDRRSPDTTEMSPQSADSNTQNVVRKFKHALSKVFPTPFRRSDRLANWGISPPRSDASVRSRSPRIFYPEQEYDFPKFPYREPEFSNTDSSASHSPNLSIPTDRSRSTVTTRHGFTSDDQPMFDLNKSSSTTPSDFPPRHGDALAPFISRLSLPLQPPAGHEQLADPLRRPFPHAGQPAATNQELRRPGSNQYKGPTTRSRGDAKKPAK